MNAEFFDALEAIEREKHISKVIMLEKVEKALTDGIKKEYGPETLVRISIDAEKKEIKAYRQFEIVEEVENDKYQISLADAKKKHRGMKIGNIMEEEFKLSNFHRLSAQTAKQVIIQGIREAEREIIAEEYKKRDAEIISAQIIRIDQETGDVIVDTGTSNVRIVKKDLIPTDRLIEGNFLKVCIAPPEKSEVGARRLVRLTRSHPIFVRRLFELNIPEIADGTIEIKGIAREAGVRCKVSVKSNDESVDPIGSCIGEHRCRIVTILRELAGEQIELVKYEEDPAEYIASVLSPAKVKSVTIGELDPEEEDKQKFAGRARVIVDADQLSLAIGALGINAKLAAKITNYKIDIKSADNK